MALEHLHGSLVIGVDLLYETIKKVLKIAALESCSGLGLYPNDASLRASIAGRIVLHKIRTVSPPKVLQLATIQDQLKFLLSFIFLFLNHGLRDYFITALPSIIACESNSSSDSEVIQSEISIFLRTFRFLQGNVESYSNSPACIDVKEGWTSVVIGAALSCIHWGWLATLAVAPFIIKRTSIKWISAASLLTSGVLTLFTELVAEETGPTGLLIFRTVQGVLQGWCYPVVFILLEEVEVSNFVRPYFFIFLAPWIGSSVAVLLGCARNPFMGAYLFGGLSTIVGGFVLCIPLKTANPAAKPPNAWRECLSSPATWACVLLQVGMAWSIHHFLVGLSFTLEFKLNRSDLLWTVFLTILGTGIITRLVAMVAINLLRNHFLTPLNRRRFIILLSSAVIITSFIAIGTSGIDSEFVSFGMTMVGTCAGVSLGLVGVRLNLHDLGPSFPTPFLILGSAGAAFGAGMGSLLFPVLSQTGSISTFDSIDDIHDGPWRLAWMLPILVIVAGCGIHLFLISVIPLPHQTRIHGDTTVVLPPACNGITPVIETDTRSFKTSRSALSFKTAVSKRTTQTVSFKTVDETIDADLQTVVESDLEECLSIALDEENETEEMKSLASGITPAPSFKSAFDTTPSVANGQEYGVILCAQDLDRTTAWLTIHHSSGIKLEGQHSAEKSRIERNILFALQW